MPKKILLADDSITIQKVVELTFSDGDYEVIATNNGAKAIQKLSEIRPDIILSDIIMPEKNGYELCEYVKSHPDFRSIPVILLTGTFEPFDPDRAEKAGCDAVVTKPFESQSLIHKVEELIAQTQQSSAATAEPEAASPFATSEGINTAGAFAPLGETEFSEPAAEESTAAENPFEEPAAPQWGSGFDTPAEEEPLLPPAEEGPTSWEAPAPEAPASDLFALPETPAEEPAFATHGDDLFAAASSADAGSDLPFESSASSSQPEWAMPAEEPSESFSAPESAEPEAPAPFADVSTQMFPKLTLDEVNQYRTDGERDSTDIASSYFSEPPTPSAPETAAFEESSATEPYFASQEPEPMFGGETPAADSSDFGGQAFEAPAENAEAVSSFGDSRPDQSMFDEPVSGETKVIPKISFEDIQRMREQEQARSEPERSVFDEPDSGETRTLPRLTLDDIQQARAEADEEVGMAGEESPASPEFPRAVPPLESAPALEAVPPLEAASETASPFDEEPAAEEAAAPAAEASPWIEEEESSEISPEETLVQPPSLFEVPAREEQPFEEPAPSEPEPMFGSAEPAPDTPFEDGAPAEEASPFAAPVGDEPAWAASDAGETSSPLTETSEPAAAAAAFQPGPGTLTDEQVDRIARRVVELMSDSVVRGIAWEVIPDLAEMIVRERIKQLENEV
jgi:CheY-like chemotaxis protein